MKKYLNKIISICVSTFLSLHFLSNSTAMYKLVPNADIHYNTLNNFKLDWSYAISDSNMVDEDFYRSHTYYFPGITNYTNDQALLNNLNIERTSYALHWTSPISSAENFIDYKLADQLQIHPDNTYSICYYFDLHLLNITDQKKFISTVRANQDLFNNISNDIYQSIITEINNTRTIKNFRPLNFATNSQTTKLYFSTGNGTTYDIIHNASIQGNRLAGRSITLHDSGFSFPSHHGDVCSIPASCSRIIDIISGKRIPTRR